MAPFEGVIEKTGGVVINKLGYPLDLRMTGNASKVKIIKPDGRILYQEATYFETLPTNKFNYYRLYKDLSKIKKEKK